MVCVYVIDMYAYIYVCVWCTRVGYVVVYRVGGQDVVRVGYGVLWVGVGVLSLVYRVGAGYGVRCMWWVGSAI